MVSEFLNLILFLPHKVSLFFSVCVFMCIAYFISTFLFILRLCLILLCIPGWPWIPDLLASWWKICTPVLSSQDFLLSLWRCRCNASECSPNSRSASSFLSSCFLLFLYSHQKFSTKCLFNMCAFSWWSVGKGSKGRLDTLRSRGTENLRPTRVKFYCFFLLLGEGKCPKDGAILLLRDRSLVAHV